MLIFLTMQDIAEPSRLPMTVTPYVDMCNMDFIQFHSRKDNTEKKLSQSSNFTCIPKHTLRDNCCGVCIYKTLTDLVILTRNRYTNRSVINSCTLIRVRR
jgi:aminopeptidase-like protein